MNYQSYIKKYIDDLAERIWSRKNSSQVSVFVGAGFSKNVIKKTPKTKDPPLWSDLRNALFTKLFNEFKEGTIDENYMGTSGIIE